MESLEALRLELKSELLSLLSKSSVSYTHLTLPTTSRV